MYRGLLRMKPTMMFAIVLMTTICLMTAFNINLSPSEVVSATVQDAPNTLYVCPTTSQLWDKLAAGFVLLKRPMVIGFFFSVIILFFLWGWALYQNLLKDKFVRDAFKTPWAFTKLLFWAVVIISLLLATPNYFRTVHLTGSTGSYVLCDNNSPGAMPVPAGSVHR